MIDPAQNINHSLNDAKLQTSIGKKVANPLLAKLRNTFNKTQSAAHQQQHSIVATPSIVKTQPKTKIQPIVKTKPAIKNQHVVKIQSANALSSSAALTQAQSNKKNDYFSTSEQLGVLDQVIAKVEQEKDALQQRVQKNETTLGQATQIDQATQITQATPVAQITPPMQPSTPLSKMKIVKPTIQTTSSFQASPQGIIGQGLTAAMDNTVQSNLNPPTPTRSAKEAMEGADRAQIIEAARGAQATEVEPTPEISPEVEAYVRKVQDDTQTPQEIVIADNIDAIPDTSHYQKRPVIILPITPEIEKKARFKGPAFSVRWLVEWSKKIMKMFFGKVIYRQEEVRK